MPGLTTFSPSPDEERTIVEAIARGGRAVVALSGGVDSALVASFAHQALGSDAFAVTVVGSSVAPEELARAGRAARAIGIEHVTVGAEPLERPEYRANGSDRCYHCRIVETSALRAFGQGRGVAQYLDGIQLDDLADDRPGLRAMDEAGFLHPLLRARWRKSEVRSSARARHLPGWDEPSNACLASRVARGEPISSELLSRIATAETMVLERGFRRVRVRVRSGAARIEVDPGELPRLLGTPLAAELQGRIRSLGFDAVSVDPRGYPTSRSELRVLP